MNNLRWLYLATMLLMSAIGYGQEKVVTSRSVESQIIKHCNYTVSYNKEYKVPNWVSWNISKEKLSKTVSRSGINFMTDPAAHGTPVTPMDYSRSGYDRGHMCPAADNRFNQTAMEESFFMTNVCPQNHTLNEKTWADLEGACRGWANHSTVYIVSGPYFKGKPKTHIGRVRVAVPDGFWKVILRQFKGKWVAIGFIMPNADADDAFRNYAVCVDDVEKLTGHDFFSELDDAIENEIESRFDLSSWR